MKVLFVNLVYGTGSTGKIIADIMNLLKKYGNDVKTLYGTGACSDNADTVKVSGKLEYYFHNAVSRFTDHAGLYSWAATRKMIREIRAFQPDLIHLHTLHGFYVNYEMLFRFLKEANIPVVWTLHDCWTFYRPLHTFLASQVYAMADRVPGLQIAVPVSAMLLEGRCKAQLPSQKRMLLPV